eukprot:COSAG02_NODE_959_length_15647_cov_74.362748_9_plen_82_part_00
MARISWLPPVHAVGLPVLGLIAVIAVRTLAVVRLTCIVVSSIPDTDGVFLHVVSDAQPPRTVSRRLRTAERWVKSIEPPGI